MSQDIEERLQALESLVQHQHERLEAQAATVERQRERIEQLERALTDDRSEPLTRRGALKTGGVLAALGVGAGTASASPTGQVGSASRPLAALYTERLDGGVTGGQAVTDLVGDGFAVQSGRLGADAGDGLAIQNGRIDAVAGQGLVIDDGAIALRSAAGPQNLDAVLRGMEQDNGTYLVTNPYELQAMAADLSASYRLAADIDASQTASWYDGKGFDPVGGLGGSNSENPFTGSFDGNGHIIDKLTINRPNTNRVGLFRQLGTSVGNLVLKNVDITGNDGVGAVVGADGGINGGGVSDCYASGTVAGSGAVGGVAGFTRYNLTRCGAAVEVSGQNRVGGLVGETGGKTYSITDCYATGAVTGDEGVGGLVGGWADVLFAGLPTAGDISTSFATGAVSGTTDVGGVIGAKAPNDANSGATTLSDTFWDLDVTTQTAGVGNATDTGTTGLNTADMQGSAASSNLNGFDFSGTWATVTSPDGYPVLQAIDEAVQLGSR
jgi:hypothetical protein